MSDSIEQAVRSKYASLAKSGLSGSHKGVQADGKRGHSTFSLLGDAIGRYHLCMARTARASVGGVCYHVLNRGNGRAEVFHKKED